MNSPKLVVVATLAIFVVAACSGSGAAPSGGDTPTATATPDDQTSTTPAPTTQPSDATATSTAPAAGAVDMCALLSASDLKTVTGAEYGDGVPDAYGQCTWLVGDAGVNTGDGQVVAAMQDLPLDTFKNTFTGGVDVTVSGHAGYWNPADGLQSIWLDVGGRTLVLSFDPVRPDGQAIAQALAEIAIGKL